MGATATTTTEATATTTTRAAAAPRTPGWARAVRGPWTVVCAAATVVLGPAAVTASALDQANAAPPHHALKAERAQAYLPADTGRRRVVA